MAEAATATGAPEEAGAVTVRWFAAAEEAAGTGQETVSLPPGGPVTVGDVLAAARARRPALADVLPSCSYLVDAVSAGPATALRTGSLLDVLPPFAGG